MKTELAGSISDRGFIQGVFNYCDRWCERCSLSRRCRVYAMEKARDPFGGTPDTELNLSHQEFWDKLHQQFQSTIQVGRADAKARGIDLEDPQLQAEVDAHDRACRRLGARNRSLARTAIDYVKAVDKWFGTAEPIFMAKGFELETVARLGVVDPDAELVELNDFVEVIRWYQHFICMKLRRAIDSRAEEELETKEWLKGLPKDSDGSAKIAMIAMERSIAAWSGLRSALGDEADGILDLLAQLMVLRRETERLFPQARAFVRPGFDEPG